MLRFFALIISALLHNRNPGSDGVSLNDKDLFGPVVDERFLSLTLSAGIIADGWRGFDFNSLRLKNLASALAPAYLRLGGTASNYIVFEDDQVGIQSYEEKNTYSGLKPSLNITIMRGIDWTRINKFVQNSNLSFLFDLNVLLRDDKDRWAPSNAKSIMDFSIRNGIRNVSWELGNEPNSLRHSMNVKLQPKRLGKDIYLLRQVLNVYKDFKNSILVGPDVNGITRCKKTNYHHCPSLKYLKKVIKHSGGVLDAITVHQYYLNGHTATAQDFINPDVMDTLRTDIKATKNVLRVSGGNSKLWLGETSSSYGGGTEGLSNRYIAGFLWLDKLGISAEEDIQIVMRQTFYGGHYSLISESLYPYPDYWISVLYKRLIGTQTLKLQYSRKNRNIRVYASCSRTNKDSVVLYGMNLSKKKQNIYLGYPFIGKPLDIYRLSPDGNAVDSALSKLNGKILRLLNDNTTLPKLYPKHIQSAKREFQIGPYEMFFLQLFNIGIKCTSSF